VKRLTVLPIVEGHGEYESIRILLTRIWTELLAGEYLEVLRPIRQSRSKLIREAELGRAVSFAMLKLGELEGPGMVLVLLDADKDPLCELGPQLLGFAQKVRPDADVAVVLAKVKYETWLVAGVESLGRYLKLESGDQVPEDPEGEKSGIGWIERRFRRPKYSKTVDQPGMTAALDLELCRRRSPSFDKLCRELDLRLQR